STARPRAMWKQCPEQQPFLPVSSRAVRCIMANSTVTPNIPAPPPPQPPSGSPRRPRSFAGPAMLILIGVIFLLANMGVLSAHGLGHLFAHYWPVLLIFWGAVRMFEYYQAQREGYETRGIGVGGVLIIVLVIIFGMAATLISRIPNIDIG